MNTHTSTKTNTNIIILALHPPGPRARARLVPAHAPGRSVCARVRPVRPQPPARVCSVGPPPRTNRKTVHRSGGILHHALPVLTPFKDYKYRSFRLCVSLTPTSQGDTTPKSHEAWLPLQK